MKYSTSVKFMVILLLAIFSARAYAWDKNVVHPLLNEKGAEQSSLSGYLTGKLGAEFPSGTSQVLDGKNIVALIAEGGQNEDESVLPLIGYLTRSSKHFHDPTKEWEKAGWLGSSMSSILWAQADSNEWSWKKARQSYFDGLTGSQKTNREKSYAQAFKGLGHLMHLVADMAVPEHTRNDTHVLDRTLETWAQENKGALDTKAVSVSKGIFQFSIMQGLSPITNLWDTYPYSGYNPNGPIGLAEYSNYNFLSTDTVFKSYEFPGRTNAFIGEPTIEVAEDGINDNLIYYQGTTSDGRTISHLAATGYLFSEISKKTQDELNSLNASLDDNCFKDYADILIPRAVGYSAALLNYFFRGDIDMVSDPDTTGNFIITNNTDESMDGAFSLYYDDTQGNRKKAATDWGQMTIPARESATKPGKSGSLKVDEPADIKEAGKYILVFNGTLGNEDGAVVGKVVSLDSVWENWESGLIGKHQWQQSLYQNNLKMEVVEGHADNTSKVLRVVGPQKKQSLLDYIETTIPEPISVPKKISFDYYIESKGTYSWDFSEFYLRLYGKSGGKPYMVDLAIVNPFWYSAGCKQWSWPYATWKWCGRAMETGRWAHAEMDIQDTAEITDVVLIFEGSAIGTFEVYIDNIDFKYDEKQ